MAGNGGRVRASILSIAQELGASPMSASTLLWWYPQRHIVCSNVTYVLLLYVCV